MTRQKELRQLIKKLGFSQRETARQLEVDERTMRYWLADREPPLMAVYALRFLVKINDA